MVSRNKKFFYLTLIIVVTVCTSFYISGVSAQESVKTRVLYISDSEGRIKSSVKLDDENVDFTSQLSSEVSFANINNFDVIFLNDVNLSESDLTILYNWAEIESHGLIIIMGSVLSSGTQILSRFGFSAESQFQNNSGEMTNNDEFNKLKGISVSNSDPSLIAHPMLGSIVWNTAPETFHWSLIPDLQPNVITYVHMRWNDAHMNEWETQNYPSIAGISLGANPGENVLVFSGWFQDEFTNTDSNEHFMVWPFFNYLMFASLQTSAGKQVPIYGQWKFAPVPHIAEQIILGALVVITGFISIWLYLKARKKRNIQKAYLVTSDGSVLDVKSEDERTTDLSESEIGYIDKEDEWEKIGFHRQLSGFLKLYFLMMILIIPQLLITSMIMPQFLNPYPQSSGWMSYTLHFFEAIWLIFDMGFNYAIIKNFAKHRIENPQKAYHYVQLFIWWEILSGVVQIGLIAFIGSLLFPLTNLNYLSWMFVAHSLIQFPGIFLVFQYFFQASQRSDFQMVAFALQQFVLRLVIQVITVPLFRIIFTGNIVYGPAFGTSIGLIVGQLIGDWALFFITWKMYSSLKLPFKPIFYADFNKEEFIETIKLGSKMMAGEFLVPLVWLLQVYLVQVFIPNSSQEQGYFELAFTIAQIPMAMTLMTSGLLGALTEAHQYKKKNLLNYNTISGFKWGMTWTLYLAATFLAIGETFIIGASGPLWIRSAQLLPLFMIMRILGPFSWQTDQEFPAADKPIYAGIAWFIEQTIRAGLMFLFLFYFPVMESVLWAYIISLIIKDIYVIITLRVKIHKWTWNVWPSYIAPILSAGMIFLIFKGLDILIVNVIGLGQGIISAFILLLLALFFGEFIHSFFYGLFGGYDDNTLSELDRASEMVTGVKKLSRLYFVCAKFGAKISPLHNKFKIIEYEAAQREADELTSIKKKLI